MITTIVVITEKKNGSAIVVIDGFRMIAAIAEKTNEDRGYLRLTKFVMAAVNRCFLLEGWFCHLWVFFNVNDDGKDKDPIDFGFERSSRRGNFGILLWRTQCILVFLLLLRSLESGFLMITAIAMIAEIELTEVYLSYHCRCDRWRVVSI